MEALTGSSWAVGGRERASNVAFIAPCEGQGIGTEGRKEEVSKQELVRSFNTDTTHPHT